MTILIDDRAGSRDLLNPLRRLHSDCHLTRLDSGDVCFSGNGPPADTPDSSLPKNVLVGVELKSLPDLLSSSANGRLQATQVPAMLRDYDIPYLVYYGEYRPSQSDYTLQVRRHRSNREVWVGFRIGKKAVPYWYLESLLLTLTASGIIPRHVTDLRHASAFIFSLYRWWSKPWRKHKGLRTFDNSRNVSLQPKTDPSILLRARIAAQLPGVGFDRAVAAAEHFPSIKSMLSADRQEWQRVPGIGKVIASSVTRALREN